MEHRHFPRKPIFLEAQLLATNGKTFTAHVLDFSAIGMRVIVDTILPARIKIVNVQLSSSVHTTGQTKSMKMFVVHKDRKVVGLCLVNERARIDIEGSWLDAPAYSAVS